MNKIRKYLLQCFGSTIESRLVCYAKHQPCIVVLADEKGNIQYRNELAKDWYGDASHSVFDNLSKVTSADFNEMITTARLTNEPCNKTIRVPLNGMISRDDVVRPYAWHNVTVCRLVSGLLIEQRDVTTEVESKQRTNHIVDTQASVLQELFPRHIINAILADKIHSVSSLARHHPMCTILFLDIVGFTSMCDNTTPELVMSFLNTLFKKLDNLCAEYKLHKVETAGDCYIVSAGVVDIASDGYMVIRESSDGDEAARIKDDAVRIKDDAVRIIQFAVAAQSIANSVIRPSDGCRTTVRIGVHSGPCTSGIVGISQPKFALFGDTMNTASRMESTCPVGRVQVSPVTACLLPETHRAVLEQRIGHVEIKGKGPMDTFLVPANMLDKRDNNGYDESDYSNTTSPSTSEIAHTAVLIYNGTPRTCTKTFMKTLFWDALTDA